MTDLDRITVVLAEDSALLRELLGRHRDETESAVAARLLEDWDASATRFVKVMPRDYKRVLTARARAIEEGLDVDTMVMESSRG